MQSLLWYVGHALAVLVYGIFSTEDRREMEIKKITLPIFSLSLHLKE